MEVLRTKNVASYLSIPMVDSADPNSFKTGETVSLTAYHRDGAGAWTIYSPVIADSFAEIGSLGVYEITLTSGEMNYDQIMMKLTAGSSQDQSILVSTIPAPANMKQIDENETDDNTATLALKKLDIQNSAGNALYIKSANDHSALIESAAAGKDALHLDGVEGYGLYASGESAGGIFIAGVVPSITHADDQGLVIQGGESGSGLNCIGGNGDLGAASGHGIISTGGVGQGGNSSGGDGLKSTGGAEDGSGTAGNGLSTIGSANGAGTKITSGSTSGPALWLFSQHSGNSGLYITGTGKGIWMDVSSTGIDIDSSAGKGIEIAPGNNEDGIAIDASGTGAGVHVYADTGKAVDIYTGGNIAIDVLSDTSEGIRVRGGLEGITIAAGSGSGSNAVDITGDGAGHGINITAGASGNGIDINAAGGMGVSIDSDNNGLDIDSNGIGLNIVGTGSEGVYIAGATVGMSLYAPVGFKSEGTNGDAMTLESSAGNGNGLSATGHGTADGIYAVGGVTNGNGLHIKGVVGGEGLFAEGGASGGHGVYAKATSGNGMVLEGVNGLLTDATAKGVYIQSSNDGIVVEAGTDGDGLQLNGSGAGHGLYSEGGSTGNGLFAISGTGGGSGGRIESRFGNFSGMHIIGFGTGHGVQAESGAGATGNGIDARSNATSGHGIAGVGSGAGNGVTGVGGVSDGHGISGTGDGNGDGIRATGAGTGNGLSCVKGGGSASTGKDLDADEIQEIITDIGTVGNPWSAVASSNVTAGTMGEVMQFLYSGTVGKWEMFNDSGDGNRLKIRFYTYDGSVITKTVDLKKSDLVTDNDSILDANAIAGRSA